MITNYYIGFVKNTFNYHVEVTISFGEDFSDFDVKKKFLLQHLKNNNIICRFNDLDDPYEIVNLSDGPNEIGTIQCDLLLNWAYLSFNDENDFLKYKFNNPV